MKIHAAILLGLIIAAAPSRASNSSLSWDTQVVNAAAQPGQRVVHATYRFRNTSAATVSILSLETSCRCTSATSDKATYAAGETGAVEVDFAVGDQTGAQEKSVAVSTDAVGMKPDVLVLRVEIPRPEAPSQLN